MVPPQLWGSDLVSPLRVTWIAMHFAAGTSETLGAVPQRDWHLYRLPPTKTRDDHRLRLEWRESKLRALSSSMETTMTFRERFRTAAASVSCAFGSPWALATAFALVVIWAATGRYFDYSDAWQLVINTTTTIVTFLMAFLIQATQYRESRAINLKIDELIRAVQGARDGFVNLDDLTDEQLEALTMELQKVGAATKIKPVPRQRAQGSEALKQEKGAQKKLPTSRSAA
jgi:low affinity Fe/Cu permease